MVLERISRDEMLMEMAFVVAKRATCSRAHVGCVISRDGRIIVTGYNGAPAGVPHCDHTEEDEFLAKPPRIILGSSYGPDDLEQWAREAKIPGRIMVVDTSIGMTFKASGCEVVEHAERNAIAFAARWGTALEGAEIHCTHAPCLACAKSILNAGIKRLTFQIPYRLTEGVELLQQAKLEIVDLSLQK